MSRRLVGPAAALAAVVALLAGAVLFAAPASAHVTVVGTTPAADAVLDTAPATVEVRFDSGLLDIGFAMVVRSADGRTVSSGPARVGLDSISTATDPAAGPGTYTVAFRVVSADGHEVTSSFAYTVSGEPAASPTPTASPTPSDLEVEGVSPAPNPPQPQDRGTRWSPALVLGVGAAAVAGAGLLAWALLAGRTRH